MNRLKISVVTVCLMFLGLSVLAKNNFSTSGFGWFADEENEVEYSKYMEFINTKLVGPVAACYQEANPHEFMTKCYSEIYCQLNNFKPGEDHSTEKLWTGSNYTGVVIYNDCGNINHICSVKTNYKEQKIEVRESFFSEWVPAEDFVKSFCEKMKAVPNKQQ